MIHFANRHTCMDKNQICCLPLPRCLLVGGADLQRAELPQSRPQLLSAALQLLLQLHVEPLQLLVLLLDAQLLAAQLLDFELKLKQMNF